MRVALLVTDLERGGTPLRLAGLARRLRQAGVEVQVGCLAPPGPVSALLAADGIPSFACDARGRYDALTLVRLARHLDRIRPDLIHATLTHANLAARLVGDWLRLPVVTSTATIEVERRWHLLVERLTAGMDRGHLVNSQTLARHVAERFGVARERIHVVPPLVDPLPRRMERAAARRQLGLTDDALVIAWVGRFDPVKRLDLAVRCIELLADAPRVFLIAGDGPARQQVEARVARSPARAAIRLLGWQEDVSPVLAAADVFLFPSLTEGMPNAVLQALAAGLPVVGSDIPALRELSGPEQRLLLVPGTTAEDYAAALRRLWRDRELRDELARRGAEWAAAHLDPQRCVAATLAVYASVLAGANGR